MINKICVAGAGTMGSGIALTVAQQHFTVVLFDTNNKVLENARSAIEKNLSTLVEKNKITPQEKVEVLSNITYASSIADCVADLVVEAIIEKMDAKIDLFTQLSSINSPECIFASNTSSLSITTLQKNIPGAERVAGLHFFNPAQIMKLVEVVKGELTATGTTDMLMHFCNRLNKTGVLCIDAPGFIVNRVARHYYLEAMKLAENNIAGIEEVDTIMEASGFKMGPFKLMDMIGIDINLAVSRSLYDAFDHAVRFEPSKLQVEKLEKGDLGKKTGKGFYQY